MINSEYCFDFYSEFYSDYCSESFLDFGSEHWSAFVSRAVLCFSIQWIVVRIVLQIVASTNPAVSINFRSQVKPTVSDRFGILFQFSFRISFQLLLGIIFRFWFQTLICFCFPLCFVFHNSMHSPHCLLSYFRLNPPTQGKQLHFSTTSYICLWMTLIHS